MRICLCLQCDRSNGEIIHEDEEEEGRAGYKMIYIFFTFLYLSVVLPIRRERKKKRKKYDIKESRKRVKE